MHPRRRIALVCLTPPPDGEELQGIYLPSYGIRRIQAAVVADPDCQNDEVQLFDLPQADVARCVALLLAFGPDIVGFSIYVWSTPMMVSVAREIKRRRPSCLIVFGGPSARSAVFSLPYYQDANTYLDAVVEGDGETIFRNIVKLPRLEASALEQLPGLTLPRGTSWLRTPPVGMHQQLDDVASPFQLDLMPRGAVAYLETYRGCPLSCRFCEWGVDSKAKGSFSHEYIARELEAFRRLEAPAVFLLDAGLNLNAKAFKALRQAAKETGVLRDRQLWAEIYPASVRDEHLDFLQEIGPTYLGVGLQSRDPEVLRLHQRFTDSPRFEQAMARLTEFAAVEVQIIMGLPGDTPEGFRRTLDYALSMRVGVRAYHCLVLPDALLTRGLPEFAMTFDPRTLAMNACLGWPLGSIGTMRDELGRRARSAGGSAGDYWWSFPRLEQWPPR